MVGQVGPVMLYDLLPPTAYEAWLALSHLCPLIFQPAIEDMEAYTVSFVTKLRPWLDGLTLQLQKSLKEAIDDFLAATLTVQWFNKPKFHLLLHLLLHIHRFGPAILMATEGFESYNFVIRLRSILSNRHAPSVDIAAAMSFMHAVRHLVSGGFVEVPGDESAATLRRQAGVQVQRLRTDRIFLKFMTMTNVEAGDAKLQRKQLLCGKNVPTNTIYIQ